MIKLAWRNILRKRGRSFFTGLAVALVVLFTAVQSGMMGAIENGIYENLTSVGGHLQVRVAGYGDAQDFGDTLLRDAGAVQTTLQGVLPEEAELVSVLEVGGLLEGDGRSRGVVLVGTQQPAALRESFVDKYLLEGAFPFNHDVESVALGRTLAESLKVGVGDTVYMYASNTEGYGAAAYTVMGLLDVPSSQSVGYVSLQAAQELAAPDALSRVEIHLPGYRTLGDDARLPAVKAAVAGALGGAYSVETWAEVNPGLKGYLDLLGPVNIVFLALFFVLAGLVVTNTIYLSIIERVREFGVMMALGLGRARVGLMVLFESLFLVGVGAAAGALLSGLILSQTAKGFSIPDAAELLGTSNFPDVLYTSVTAERVVIIVVFVLATGILAALLPARTAGRLEPVEAMRFTA